MKKLLLIPLILTLAACASAGPKIFVAPEQLDRAKFVAPEVAPAQQMNIEWTIITKDNVEQKMAEMQKKTGSVTFFALTAQGYQNLSINTSELRRYIQQQNAVIAALKKYYEAPVIKEPAKNGQ